jgi:hypothetical protein
MRAKGLGPVLVAVTCVALSLAGAATAGAAQTVEPRAGRYFEAKLPTSDGWSVYLRGSGPHAVELDIANPEFEPHYTTMNYSTGGRVGANGIEADLGRFGHVELRFAAPPEKSVVRFPNCKGTYREVVRTGTLSGDIEFAALAGPQKVDLDSVEGEIRGPTKGVCKPVQVVFGPEPPASAPRAAVGSRAAPALEFAPENFLARRRSSGRTIDLYAFGLGREVIDMAATTTRRFGKVLVATNVHAARGAAGPGAAAHLTTTGPAARPSAATLRAGSPFSGIGRYRSRPGAPPTWLGSLAVRIPGEGKINLAGPDFHAVICGDEKSRRERRCERTVAPPHTV